MAPRADSKLRHLPLRPEGSRSGTGSWRRSSASRAGGNASWGRAHEFGDFGNITEICRPVLGTRHANSVAPQNSVARLRQKLARNRLVPKMASQLTPGGRKAVIRCGFRSFRSPKNLKRSAGRACMVHKPNPRESQAGCAQPKRSKAPRTPLALGCWKKKEAGCVFCRKRLSGCLALLWLCERKREKNVAARAIF